MTSNQEGVSPVSQARARWNLKNVGARMEDKRSRAPGKCAEAASPGGILRSTGSSPGKAVGPPEVTSSALPAAEGGRTKVACGTLEPNAPFDAVAQLEPATTAQASAKSRTGAVAVVLRPVQPRQAAEAPGNRHPTSPNHVLSRSSRSASPDIAEPGRPSLRTNKVEAGLLLTAQAPRRDSTRRRRLAASVSAKVIRYPGTPAPPEDQRGQSLRSNR